MAVASVEKEIAAVRKSAESMVASAPAAIGAAAPGDVVRQGDLYLVCLDSPLKGGPIKDRQLAPGTTQGSRHVADGDCEVLQVDGAVVAAAIKKVCKAVVPVELLGPVLSCRGKVTVTHPEHGWRTLPADSSWAVVFQRAYAEEVRRVLD